jgi:hypothetical protein
MLQNQYFVFDYQVPVLRYPPALLFFGSKSNKSINLPENPRPGKSPIAIAWLHKYPVAHSRDTASLKPTVWSICITPT